MNIESLRHLVVMQVSSVESRTVKVIQRRNSINSDQLKAPTT